jgi:hypothetical protein
MRRLDWFLAAIVATFLIAVTVIETSNMAVGAVGFSVSHNDGAAAGEVAMRRLVGRLPHPPVLGVDPQ